MYVILLFLGTRNAKQDAILVDLPNIIFFYVIKAESCIFQKSEFFTLLFENNTNK